MRKITTYLLVLIIGMLLAFLYTEKTKKEYRKQEAQVIRNGIKKVQKLVVTEGSFSEIYSYEDSNKYFFETLSFDKKAIIPDVRFFDLQQSQFNTFSASELNTIRQNALKQLKDNARLIKLRENAKKNLLETLENLFVLSKSYGWKVEETQDLKLLQLKLLD